MKKLQPARIDRRRDTNTVAINKLEKRLNQAIKLCNEQTQELRLIKSKLRVNAHFSSKRR